MIISLDQRFCLGKTKYYRSSKVLLLLHKSTNNFLMNNYPNSHVSDSSKSYGKNLSAEKLMN